MEKTKQSERTAGKKREIVEMLSVMKESKRRRSDSHAEPYE